MDKMFQFDNGKNNRNEWEFSYTASQLLEAAKAQLAFRQERVVVWEAKKEEVMKKIRESGLTVHESVSAQFSNYTSNRNRGAQVIVDETLQGDLDECIEKISTHRDAATQYNAWVQVFEANKSATLTLKVNDWLYFFGK